MFASTGELIIFAVKAGIKLGQQGKTAYAEATINRDLTLPLPNFQPSVSTGIADSYFAGAGNRYVNEIPGLEKLYRKSMVGDVLSPAEEKKYIDYYLDFKREDDIKAGLIKGDGIGLSSEALLSLVKVRQWALRKSPFPSAYQRVLGTLIEIGVDYFSKDSGIIDKETAAGKALLGFLNSVDHLDFATSGIDTLARKLFIAALESIEGNPELLGADKATEHLVRAVASGLITDINRHVDAVGDTDLTRKEEIYEWGQTILRSVLSNAGEEVFENPSLYLPVRDIGERALVTSIGKTFLDLVLEDDTVDLQNLFSRKALDRIVKTTLKVLSKHPSLVGVDNQGLKKIMSAVLKEFSGFEHEFNLNMVPEIMRVILEKTAANAELVWPDGFNDPGKHLLIVAAKELVEELTSPPANGSGWKPQLSRSQIMHIVQVALDEVVRNPQWLIDMAESKAPYPGTAVGAALRALSEEPGRKLTPDSVKTMAEEVIRAVARDIKFLDTVKMNGKDASIIEHAMDTIVESLLADDTSNRARWILAREGVFEVVVGLVLALLEKEGLSAENITLVGKALTKTVDGLSAGNPWNISEFLDELVLTIEGGENAS